MFERKVGPHLAGVRDEPEEADGLCAGQADGARSQIDELCRATERDDGSTQLFWLLVPGLVVASGVVLALMAL